MLVINLMYLYSQEIKIHKSVNQILLLSNQKSIERNQEKKKHLKLQRNYLLMALNLDQKSYITIAGSIIVHLVLGTIYLWGVITVYITSYFRTKDNPDLTLKQAGVVFPIMMFSVATGIPLGMKLIKKTARTRIVCFILTTLASACIFIASWQTQFGVFVIFYSLFFGVLDGASMSITLYIGLLYYPKKRGLISGLILVGYGLASLIYSQVFFQIVNKQNLQPIKAGNGESYFMGDAESVAQKVPEALRWLSLAYLLQMWLGSMLLIDHPSQTEMLLKQQNAKKEEMQKGQEQKQSQLKLNTLVVKVPQNNDDENKIGQLSKQIQNSEQNANQLVENQQTETNQNENINLLQIKSNQEINYKSDNKIEENKGTVICITESTNKIPRDVQIQIQDESKIIEDEIEYYKKLGCPNFSTAIKTKYFYFVVLTSFLTGSIGLCISGNYKTYGKEYISDDAFLTLIGSLSGITNGLTRPFWSALLDKYKFKDCYAAVCIVQIILCVTFQFAVKHDAFYLFWVVITMGTFGGTFGMLLALCAQFFGTTVGSEVYGIVWYGYAGANFLQFALVALVKDSIGFPGIFYIFAGMNGLSLIWLRLMNYQPNWKPYYEKIKEMEHAKKQKQIEISNSHQKNT
ncbi:oxalate/formate antiporter family transporter (macronuclear) [Tetrahymena thermophila SB210]|uniref:Oxalate/formate antiporter family transporter n=1 Tax=Tetrahymena thermophila (strain SB210) TaxID=312017 RepID=I7LVV6_TETTS|nr:oxalate/formate antiporter family transporter [Tetrahymena thermophila SB210]EAR99903.1 oxalate/formate antiporter family transporter [Tetrahymena thermophila SB210]|eukprot:XP_001020148.1 oxalate/formate antiporter family transporter [Tetrahymena thermophila SB210]